MNHAPNSIKKSFFIKYETKVGLIQSSRITQPNIWFLLKKDRWF